MERKKKKMVGEAFKWHEVLMSIFLIKMRTVDFFFLDKLH
jgi:hypothetical protein